MSTNLEYRARERQRKRESRRQASEAQREKGRQRSRARDKKQRRHFFVGRTTWKFCRGGDKMRNASGHQCKEKMSGSEKKVSENTYDISSIKTFLEVSRRSRAKQRQRNVQKSMLHVQSCFFANQTYCCFFTILRCCLRCLALHDFIFVWTKYKYYRQLRF